MNLVVNGERRHVHLPAEDQSGLDPSRKDPSGKGRADGQTPISVESLLVQLGLPLDRVAVEHNGTIVPKAERSTRLVHEGDIFEIVTLVGGG